MTTSYGGDLRLRGARGVNPGPQSVVPTST